MEERIKTLENKIDLLEWKIEILQEHVEFKGAFNVITELNITRNQFSQIIDVIRKYAKKYNEVWDDTKCKRRSFEKEFAEINDVFEKNIQAVQTILKNIAKEANCPNYKLLFVRLYGHMPKYEGVFSEIGLK